MDQQTQYDDAMFEFSKGDYASAIARLRTILDEAPEYFDAQLSIGMAYFRLGDFATAIAEGKKAEALRPKDQLVHTNLSLFYMKTGDKVTAEHHGLQARIAGWRDDPEAKNVTGSNPDLQLAKPKPPVPPPEQFPDMPWKKKSKQDN